MTSAHLHGLQPNKTKRLHCVLEGTPGMFLRWTPLWYRFLHGSTAYGLPESKPHRLIPA